MDIIQEIKIFVEKECKNPKSRYGYRPFHFHFSPVVEQAKILADKYGGDKEIIILAAWLHDIGSIIDGRKNHHITGARIAEKKLREFNYPEEKIEIIKKCILNHRGSQKRHRETIEEKIVAEADVIDNFNNIPGIFEAAFTYENQTQDEAKESVKIKLENKWNQLYFESSKKILKPKYEAVMLLFS